MTENERRMIDWYRAQRPYVKKWVLRLSKHRLTAALLFTLVALKLRQQHEKGSGVTAPVRFD